MITLSCPSKTYAMGEYAILAGGDALLVATPPRFDITLTQKQGPAAKDPVIKALQDEHPELRHYQAHMQHPLQGLGGLGASGAQYIAWWALSQHASTWDHTLTEACWQDYRRHAAMAYPHSPTPSGGDIWSQGLGSSVYLQQATQMRAQRQPMPDDLCLVLWHQGRSLATHTHLKQLQHLAFDSLSRLSHQGCVAWCEGRTATFIDTVVLYGAALYQLGLVAHHTQQHLNVIHQWPGVLAAKGCGAMGAETLMIWTEKRDHDMILSLCEEHLTGFVLHEGSSLAPGAAVR